MNDSTQKAAPPLPTVADAVRSARERDGLTVRELARRAGISHTQVSRLESGEVTKPSPEVLVSIGKGLDQNPIPLLILAGHYDIDEAKTALRPMFREDAELPQEWGGWKTWEHPDDVYDLLTEPDTSIDVVKQIAAEVFAVPESDETIWDPSYLLAAARGEGASQLQEFMTLWRFLTPDLRERWLTYGAKLRDIADLDFRIEYEGLDKQIEATPGKHRMLVRDLKRLMDRHGAGIEENDPELAAELRHSHPDLFGEE